MRGLDDWLITGGADCRVCVWDLRRPLGEDGSEWRRVGVERRAEAEVYDGSRFGGALYGLLPASAALCGGGNGVRRGGFVRSAGGRRWEGRVTCRRRERTNW